MAGVWIFAETREQSFELLNIGRNLADELETKLVSLLHYEHDLAQNYIMHGADEVLLLPSLAEDQSLEAYIPVIVDEAKKENPDIFLVAGTIRGKEVAARIASRLDTGMCSECVSLNLDKESKILEMERLVYGGAGVQKVTCSTRPQMATIPLKTFEPAIEQEGRQGQVRDLPAPPPSPIKVIGKKAKIRNVQDLREARVVVCVGRGVEKEEDMALARDLAEALGGEIGCTRPISEEMHWLSEDLCIGLSGVKVKPDIYIGMGVSGQIQHITGFRDARVICAINNDENAPIFEASDYGIVGDLYKVVPELIKEIKKLK